MIIGFGNKKGVGKDTTAQMMLNHPKFKDYKIVHFADSLKQICGIILNVPIERFEDQNFKASELPKEWWVFEIPCLFGGNTIVPYIGNETEYPTNMLRRTTVRDLLQLVGTECFRDVISPNTWTNIFRNYYNANSKIIVTDVRFPNEALLIKELGGKVVRVNRLVPENSHPSEKALDDYDFDYTIQNTGTLEDLKVEVNKFIKKLK